MDLFLGRTYDESHFQFQIFLGVQKCAPSKQVKAIKGVINVRVPAPGKPTAEQKLKAFSNDPEKSIKIFMSSYSRSNGYFWYHFFFSFEFKIYI